MPVLAHSSQPSTYVPSLKWDSCFHEPFLGGHSDFLGKPSILRLVESAGNISSTVMSVSQMDADAEEVLEEVDSIMSRIRINPLSDIQEEFLEDGMFMLEGMMNDAEACLKLFMTL